jgi:hypothetical protein
VTDYSIVPKLPATQGASFGSDGSRRAAGRFVIPTHRTIGMAWIASVLIAILAALFAVAIVQYRQSSHAPAYESGFRAYPAYLDDYTGAGLPVGMTAAWRFDSATKAVPEPVLAVRIGAQDADLSIVSWARNRAAGTAYYGDTVAMRYAAIQCRRAAILAHGLAATFDQIPDGSNQASLSRITEDEAERCATISSQPRDLAMKLSLNFYPRYIELGSWLETTRVAAARGDSAYFRYSRTQAEAVFAASLPDLKPGTHATLVRLRQLSLADSGYAFDKIARESTAALVALSGSVK